MTVSQIVIKARMNRILIFKGLEQGRGKYSNRIYLYYKPNAQNEVTEWL